MQDSEEITVITDKLGILSCMQEISSQNIVITISTSRTDIPQKYKSRIIKVDKSNNHLLLHQLLPTNWIEVISPGEVIHVSCQMKNGPANFSAKVSPIEEGENNLYCQLSMPEEVNLLQLRSFFRVALIENDSSVSITTKDGSELTGKCRNLSLTGGLLQLNSVNGEIREGDLIYQNHLIIPEILDLSFAAKICHIHHSSANTVLIGIKFLDLRILQLNAIRTAINKLERLSITKKTSSSRNLVNANILAH